MDLADWLRGLGLERYEPAFRENEIDAGVLPSLTAEDLKDLGVTLVGRRRRLLDAIATLGAEAPAAPSLTFPRLTSTLPSPARGGGLGRGRGRVGWGPRQSAGS
jgi:SAM domain (Sterile alpha motif)